MVKLDYLEAFNIYRTKPPIIMPEDSKQRKKHCAYIVLAPSIDAELSYLTKTKNLNFRYLFQYFIEKRWTYTFKGLGRQIVQPNQNGEVSNLITKYNTGNLKNIKEVTSYLPMAKVRPLKDLNVLVEVNHITDAILSNGKDHRLMLLKTEDLLNEYIRMIHQVGAYPENYLGAYTSVTTVIPMDLWFTTGDYISPMDLLKKNSKNPMGLLLNKLCNITKLKEMGRVVLVDSNMVLILDPNSLPDETKPNFIYDLIIRFMIKAKNIKSGRIDISDIDNDTGAIIEPEEASLIQAEDKTNKEVTTDEILEKAKIDPDSITVDKRKQVEDIIDKNVKKSVNVPSTNPIKTPEPSEVIHANVEITKPADVDVILSAKLEGKSIQSYKRDQMLKEKYKTIKVGDVPLTEITEIEEKYDVPSLAVPINTVNEGLKNVTTARFEKTYNDNMAAYDLTNILMHFSTVMPSLYLNKDIKIDDVSDSVNRIYRYTVEFEDEYRKRHHFSFKMPKMYKDKYLYLNGKQLNITHQKLPFPITKTAPDRCQCVSNYNKIFSYRYGTNLSPRITKIKKLFNSPDCPKSVRVTRGNGTSLNKNYLTTIEYDDLSANFVNIQIGNVNHITTIYLMVQDTIAMFPSNIVPKTVKNNITDEGGNTTKEELEDGTLFPLATLKVGRAINTYYFLSGKTNQVFDQNGNNKGELSDFIVNSIYEIEPKAEAIFNDTSAGTKFMYSRCKVMAQDVPMILVLGAADPGGLVAVLEKSKMKYYFTDKRPKVDKNITGVVPFKDGWLVYDRYPYENSLLLNGLSVFPTSEFNYYDMGMRETYIEIFDLLYSRRTLIDGLENFYYMMIDPITKDILERLSMPTDFTTLMLYCNGTLADNKFQIDSDYNNSRIRSNEIIYSHLYRELAAAWAAWKDGRAEKFSIPEDVIIKLMLTSNIVDPHSTLNVTLEAENDLQIKLKGPSGMNEDHSFTTEKRAYHPSMKGIIAMNSTPSGEVGINRHMTLNSNINDVRGFVNLNKDSYDGTELASPGELLQTFGPESSDIERVAMAISQSKHMVPVASQSASPITYDMERVIPHISNDFAFCAKKNGKVIDIKDELMIIQYEDGSFEDIDLSEHPDKNIDGGFEIMNKLDTDFKPNDKFYENQVLAYNKKYINSNDMFGEPCANIGTLARVALVCNGGVFEDSGYMTDSFAHKLATKITKQKRVILSKYANVKYMAKVGQAVKANDPILTFDDTEDAFTSQLLATMALEAEDEDEVIATTAPVITKVTGVIKSIDITYTVPLNEMTPSLKKITEEYVSKTSKREKTLSKYVSPQDSNTLLKPSTMTVPDDNGKVAGTKVGDGVIIDFYIEYLDIASVGDKTTNFTALKCTNSFVIPDELAAYTESNPERKVDAYLSALGVSKRMCLDLCKVGGLTKIIIEKKRYFKEKYGEQIKNELKKK